MRLELWLVFAALAALLLWIYGRHRVAAGAWRARLLDGVERLLTEWKRREDRHGFPRLTGQRESRQIEVGLECDHTAVRERPCLWLTVTLLGPLRIAGGLHLLAPVPDPRERMHACGEVGQPDWPAGVRLTTDIELAALDWLREPAARFFEDACAKELVLTPNGLQLVYLLEQSHTGWEVFLPVLRFDIRAVNPDLVEQLMVHAFTMATALEGSALARVA
jgi:hypothetical protein